MPAGRASACPRRRLCYCFPRAPLASARHESIWRRASRRSSAGLTWRRTAKRRPGCFAGRLSAKRRAPAEQIAARALNCKYFRASASGRRPTICICIPGGRRPAAPLSWRQFGGTWRRRRPLARGAIMITRRRPAWRPASAAGSLCQPALGRRPLLGRPSSPSFISERRAKFSPNWRRQTRCGPGRNKPTGRLAPGPVRVICLLGPVVSC